MKVHKLVPTAWGERRYLLFDGDQELGRLEFESALSTRARATASGEAWLFERVGVLNPGLIVRRAADGSEVLAAKMTAGGGVAVTLNGRTWRWKATSVLHGELAWVRDEGQVAIRYQPKLKGFNLEQLIEVVTDDVVVSERLLLFLGAYLAVQTYTDTAVVTAAVLAATVVS